MKTIIIRGYYGRDNLGDELMKDIFIRSLKHDKLELLIMNSNPKSLKREYGIATPSELVTGKKPTFKIAIKRLRTIVSADVFVFGGGTILTDKHGFMHLLENSAYFLIRKFLHRDNLLISVGATKFSSRIGRILCRILIKTSTGIYVRDNDSYKLLRKMCNNSSRIYLASDMVLLAQRYIPPISIKFPNTVGVFVMPYYFATYHTSGKDKEILTSIAEQLQAIQEKKPNVVFKIIPIQYGKNNSTDYDYSYSLYEMLKDKVNVELCAEQDLKKKIELICRCEIVISMRLHALMIAALSGGKVIAIDHNEKISYFMKRYSNSEFGVSIDDITTLSKVFEEVYNQPEMINCANLNKDYELASECINAIKKSLKEVYYGKNSC